MKRRNLPLVPVCIGLSLSLGLSACASEPQTPTAASTTVTQQQSIVGPESFDTDEERQNYAGWEKSHANYQRDLEFANLESSQDAHYKTKANLINARLYVEYAEADELALGHVPQVRQDLRQARAYLSRAAVKAGAAEQIKIRKLAKEMTLKAINGNSCGEAAMQQARFHYQRLKDTLDELLQG
jgi:hypothetical protein